MEFIDWKHIHFFTKSEFNEDPDKYADPTLIYTLDKFRLTFGERIFPSPVEGAFVRFDGSKTSQHYVGDKENPIRKTTAIDFFPEGTPIEVYTYLLTNFLIKGIGIYLDTKGNDGLPWIMFHMDIREKGFKAFPLIWFCKKEKGINKYYYPQNNSKYWSFLTDERMYKRKVFGSGIE
jgi:hypothetical protein